MGIATSITPDNESSKLDAANVIGLGIDTTFDDTSIAIIRGKREILANLTLSQYKDHEQFGGVVPERASRKHLEVINKLIDEALLKAEVSFKDIGYIAVTHYPGLLGSILVGLSVAKALSMALKIPLVIWGEELRDKVANSGATVVVRPDSGDPVRTTHDVADSLMAAFGNQLNSKGYRVLPQHIRIIQGDGVNRHSIREILENFRNNAISADNIGFGMGGALLQQVNRDTMEFAMKCSAVRVNGKWRDVFKSPVGDPSKNSKPGRLSLIKRDGEFKTIRVEMLGGQEDMLKPVFRNGEVLRRDDLNTVRRRTEDFTR